MAWTSFGASYFAIDDILGFQTMNKVTDNMVFLESAGVGTSYITSLAVTTAKIAAANVTLAKLAADAKVFTGTYAGDGAVSLAISGVGFQPRVVMILGYASGDMFIKTDTMPATGAVLVGTGNSTDYIIALGADGFTVDAGGADSDPNTNGATYYYMCLG